MNKILETGAKEPLILFGIAVMAIKETPVEMIVDELR
jgi:hypothetical protein